MYTGIKCFVELIIFQLWKMKKKLVYFGSNRTGQDLFQQQNVVLYQSVTF